MDKTCIGSTQSDFTRSVTPCPDPPILPPVNRSVTYLLSMRMSNVVFFFKLASSLGVQKWRRVKYIMIQMLITSLTCDTFKLVLWKSFISLFAFNNTRILFLQIDFSENWLKATFTLTRFNYQIKIDQTQHIFIEEKYSSDISVCKIYCSCVY